MIETGKLQLLLKDKTGSLKSWWRRHLTINKNSNRSISRSSSHTVLDWRSLSPDRPPLPFLTTQPSSPTTNNHNLNTIASTLSTKLTPIDFIEDTSSSTSAKNSNNNPSNKPTTTVPLSRKPSGPLFPILEESETMITDSTTRTSKSSSPVSNNSSEIPYNHSSKSNSNDSILPSPDAQNESGVSVRSFPSLPATISATAPARPSHTTPLPPPSPTTIAQHTTLSDSYLSDDMIGNEERCKRKFAKMILAASKYQKQQENQDTRPTHMALLFDDHENLDMMQTQKQGKSEYHKFDGNAQYIPPELFKNTEYQHEPADVWVLGIYLYRMLVGKYPFSASNDTELFKKMLHGQYSIPTHLSEDSQDLIKRMLGPVDRRASLDLIIYHEWMKDYQPILLEQQFHLLEEQQLRVPSPVMNPPSTTSHTRNSSFMSTVRRSNSIHAESPPESSSSSSNNKATQHQEYRHSKSKKRLSDPIKKAFLLLVQGPFPPPKQPYKDLAHLGTRKSAFASQRAL